MSAKHVSAVATDPTVVENLKLILDYKTFYKLYSPYNGIIRPTIKIVKSNLNNLTI